MGHSVAEWTNSLVLQMPRGLIWNYEPNSTLYKYVAGYAPRLEAAETNADLLLDEMRPETCFQTLPEWETYLGLPECNVSNQGFESRRAAVVEKYHRKGGLQAWNIEKLAADLGFDIEVQEIFPHHCLRGCTYPLYEERYRHVLRINVYGITQAYATCLDNCLTPLVLQTAAILECTLNTIKLGGKYYEFVYYYDEESV
ncbi:YmfQ family protein [Vibrio sp.]|uniref:YmfQ family protein n=1 Tax=Vibrio sp. TaxID=678 RepID=UPI003AA7D73B